MNPTPQAPAVSVEELQAQLALALANKTQFEAQKAVSSLNITKRAAQIDDQIAKLQAAIAKAQAPKA